MSHPRPLFPLLSPLLVYAAMPALFSLNSNFKIISYTRGSWSRLVQCSTPTRFDRYLACWPCAQHVVPCVQSIQSHLLLRRAQELRRCLLHNLMAMPATGASALSAAPLSMGSGDCALSAAPPATVARASSASPSARGLGPAF